MSNFENLKVWHKAIELAVNVYNTTAENKLFQKDFALRDQIRRASVSISSNISEGDELGTDKQAIRQFYIAKGSSAELFTQLTISRKIGYQSEPDSDFLLKECKTISAMLNNLIKASLKQKTQGVYFTLCPAPCALSLFLF
jgi:four helix bundle protein